MKAWKKLLGTRLEDVVKSMMIFTAYLNLKFVTEIRNTLFQSYNWMYQMHSLNLAKINGKNGEEIQNL